MGPGQFTETGHFIVLHELVDSQIKIADPKNIQYNTQLWDIETILNESSIKATAGGPFWSVSK
jgi:hypothetical protein